MAAPFPIDEAARLARVHALSVLDTDAEPLFDALTKAAALIAGSPIALLTLVDADRQWFKSNVGLGDVSETPRASAFCAHAILDHELFEIADAHTDPRFSDNPLVTGEPHIRFYAGAPLEFDDGLRVGSLCVIDREPRSLSKTQREALAALASAATEALELRRLALSRQAELERETQSARDRESEARQLSEKLHASEAFLDRTGTLAGVGGWQVELGSNEVVWSDETCRIHDLAPGYRPTLQEALDFFVPESRELISAAIRKSITDGVSWNLELQMTTASGRKMCAHTIGSVQRSADGKSVRLIGAIQDVTIRKRVVSALEASDRRFRKLFEYSLGLICTHDHDGVLLSVNPAAARSLGYSIGELLGRPLTDFMPSARHPAFRSYLLRILTTDSDQGMMELVAKDGTIRIWQYHNILDNEGDEPYMLGHAQDITQSHQQALSLQEISLRDPLTGCYNRRFLDDVSSREQRGMSACLTIDLDHFKQVNDTYGHQRGDEVLIEMSQFLSRHVRPEDAVVRLGGDEFMVLLRNIDEGVAESIVSRIEHDRADAPVGFTLGWSMVDQGTPLEQGLAEADRRLYEKRAMRGR